MNERLKKLRSYLNLNQREFSQKISIGQSTLAMFETGQRELKDIHISQICSVFNVNEDWLRTGEGEMFEIIPTDELDKLADRYNLNPLAKKLIESFVTLEEKEMNFLLDIVRKMNPIVHDEIAVTKDEYAIDIDKEVEAYRLELEAEQKGITSSAYGDIKSIQAK